MNKTSALRIRIEPELHEAFLTVCKAEGIPAAQVLRSFMRQYVLSNQDAVQRDLFADSGLRASQSIPALGVDTNQPQNGE